MIWLYTIVSVFLVSLISLIGVIALALNEKKIRSILLFLVSFSTGALLGDVFIHILPELSEEAGLTLNTSVFILIGILLFFILEKFVCWRHCHVPTSESHPHPVGVINLVGDGLHNFIDGAVIAGSFMVSPALGIATTLAVVFHEIPQEIGDFSILIHAGYTKIQAIFFNFLSALLAIAGALLVLIIGSPSTFFISMILGFTAGGFIYLAGSDLIPELHKETKIHKSLIQLFAIIFGIFIMYVLLLVFE